MSERTQKLREIISVMPLHSNDRKVISQLIAASNFLLDELEEQERFVVALDDAVSHQNRRHDNQIADLRKQIDKLSGVHGA